MALKQEQHYFKGMQRDLSVSKFNPEYAFDAQNIRITARENNTLLTVTNEKGNKEVPLKDSSGAVISIDGVLLGYNVLNQYVTLFTKGTKDNIYRLENKGTYMEVKTLFAGNLNFSTDNPIENIGVYENNDIQKVYWVDGLNQTRVINIAADDTTISKWDDGSFNFAQDLQLNEVITVVRNDLASGLFSSGVIQYAFTYYNKYGQESNIFYTTPLQYISFSNRGASPEDKVSNSFTITIKDPDSRFDYVRVYSIHRASIDATPNVLNVVDLPVDSTQDIIYTDNGTTGATVDPTELLYLGGEEVVFKTMAQKDNTLFLGNADIKRKLISKEVIAALKGTNIGFGRKNLNNYVAPSGLYPYKNGLQLGSRIKTFKYLEWYRFGLQFQHRTGKWSEPVWVNDAYNTTKPDTSAISSQPSLVQANYYLTPEIISQVVEDDFVRVRGVVVYPTLTDREVIAQGMLCPTVYNMGDRNGNAPYVQSSWFTRPYQPYDYTKAKDYQAVEGGGYNHDWLDRDQISGYSGNSKWGLWNLDLTTVQIKNPNTGAVIDTFTVDDVNKGAWVEFRHDVMVTSDGSRGSEIQCLVKELEYSTPYSLVGWNNDADKNKWVADRQEFFYVDNNILTFHSPEIEFDDSTKTIDSTGLKLRIVGMIPLTSFASDIDIQTSTPVANNKMKGFYKEPLGVNNLSRFGFRQMASGIFWFDDLSDYKKDTGNSNNLTTGFLVYPWHRNGSLNNFGTPDSDHPTRPAMLQYKKMSNLRFSYTSVYLDSNHVWNAYVQGDTYKTGISGVNIFDSNEQELIRIPAPKNSGLPDLNYYGNIDKVVSCTKVVGTSRENGYPIYVTGPQNADQNSHLLFSMVTSSLVGSEYTNTQRGTEPVHIKYKSTAHAVVALNWSTDGKKIRVLPNIEDCSGYPSTCWAANNLNYILPSYFPWTHPRSATVSQDTISSPVYGSLQDQTLGYGFLWIGELYNDNVENRFGGQTEEAFENNLWLPAGEPVSIISGYDDNNKPIPVTNAVNVAYTEGDTFLERYDCLKTYPYTQTDQNSVVDIVSFLCETRVNIDGRYDKNRGQINNMVMTPENFNKMNMVYSQKNNFFNYRGVNHNKFNLNYFPNTVTWTKEKQLGGIIDTWTNITMASTLDLDGDKGEVISLNIFNNEIFCFQRQGLSNILFNSRVQIPTSDGLPIEITNGLKVSGKRYISNTIGCANKWSIAESPSGLYFVDNETNSLYLFNGKIESLSDRLGFRQWISTHNVHTNWDPVNYNNYRSFYDKNNNDVYFTYKDHCLCFSELVGQFTSFMSYEQVPAMFNISSDFYAFKDGKMWEQFAGDYNMFFGQYKPYSITFVANAEEPLDKIFNTVEFRADAWNGEQFLPNTTFDTLEVWNEYQYGSTSLQNIINHPSPLKRKFRIWRANIPRDNSNNRDRIRNTWAYIKLGMNTPNTYRTEFHDAIIHYFA